MTEHAARTRQGTGEYSNLVQWTDGKWTPVMKLSGLNRIILKLFFRKWDEVMD
jgi:hypothetical protein